MASVTHTFVSAVGDGADATLVRPSNWNATHTLVDVAPLASPTFTGTVSISGQDLQFSNASFSRLSVLSVNNPLYIDVYRNAANTGEAFIIRAKNAADALTDRVSLTSGVDTAVWTFKSGTNVAFGTGQLGFFNHALASQQTKAGHNNWVALSDVVSALVSLGLFDTS